MLKILGVRGKMKKGKENRRKLTEKRGKGLKNACFLAINSKKNRGGLKRFEKFNLKRGVGGMIRMHNIYPCIKIKTLL